MAPFNSEDFKKSLTVCCVASDGKRKKRWEDMRVAAAIAIRIDGKYYRCRFHSETFHVTSQKPMKTTVGERLPLKRSPETQLQRLMGRLEKVETELMEIHRMAQVLTIDTLKPVSLELYQSMHQAENTARQILTELEYVESLLDSVAT